MIARLRLITAVVVCVAVALVGSASAASPKKQPLSVSILGRGKVTSVPRGQAVPVPVIGGFCPGHEYA
jgi:hypothetical protein